MGKGRPPLYELIDRDGGVTSMGSRPGDEPVDVGLSLGPGRRLQLPVGYIFIGVTAVGMLMVLSFVIGHQRGATKARADAEREFLDSVRQPERRPADPLGRGTPAASDGPGSTVQTSPRPRGGDDSRASEVPSDGSGWGPLESDPRIRGTMYFVLAETTVDGAIRVADFCRSRGLETYLVPGENTRLRRVIVLPGFEPSQRSSRRVMDLEARIHQVGDEWKLTERRSKGFRDAYPRTY